MKVKMTMPHKEGRRKKEAPLMRQRLRGMAGVMLAVALIFTLIPVMYSAAEPDGKYFQFLDLSTRNKSKWCIKYD